MPERVVIDDVFLQISPNHGGITRLWLSLLTSPSFAESLSARGIELIILSRSGRLDQHTQFESIPFPSLDHRYWALDTLQIDRILRRVSADLFVSTYFTFSTEVPSWIWCYDFIPERLELRELEFSVGWQQRQSAILRCDFFSSISKSTSTDLKRYYPHSTRGTTNDVIYPWVTSPFMNSFSKRTERQIFNRTQNSRRLLIVGNRYQIGGYKNMQLVLNALAKGYLDNFQLTCVGGEPLTLHEQELALKRKVEIKRINASDQDLVSLYKDSFALLYPSLAEGCGLPILEALACRLPVICSRATSTPEVASDCGAYLSDNSAEALGEALVTVGRRDFREHVWEHGPKHAGGFSAVNSAHLVVESWHHAIQESRMVINRDSRRMYWLESVTRLANCEV